MQLVLNDNIEYQYLLYEPDTEENETYPLIIFLHGAGERGDELSALKAHSIPKIFEENADYPCFVVSPQCKQGSFWTAEIYQLKKFIDAITEKYPIDKNRIQLTGVSMGGFGTWHAGVLTMPIRIFHGDADTVVNVRESIDMYEALKKTNPNVEISILPGVGHNAWDYAYNDDTIRWMLEQSK